MSGRDVASLSVRAGSFWIACVLRPQSIAAAACGIRLSGGG
jgi:hypothetical protein